MPDRDGEQLKMLAIFHFICAGIAFMGFAIIVLQYVFMKSILSSRVRVETSSSGEEVGVLESMPALAEWGFVFAFVLLIAGITLNGLSGMFLLKRRHRGFSLITAGVNCVQIPIGTVLGIITIMVLNRASVRMKYSAALPSFPPSA
jgi:hypothetical protein